MGLEGVNGEGEIFKEVILEGAVTEACGVREGAAREGQKVRVWREGVELSES